MTVIDNLPFVSQMRTRDMKDGPVKAMRAKVYEKGEYVSINRDYATLWTVIEKGQSERPVFTRLRQTSL
jgi:hypothetical protein